MEDFSQQFTHHAAAKLRKLSADLQNADAPSEFSKSETFRTLHTIKGTAQTFGFSAASRLAHALENLLAGGEEFGLLFREGVEILTESLERKDFVLPESFLKKAGLDNVRLPSIKRNCEVSAPEIPDEFFRALSGQEKLALRTALDRRQNLFCFEVGFEPAEFAERLINFREALGSCGEIIAALPGAKFDGTGKIGFRILYASVAETSRIETARRESGAEIIFDFYQAQGASPNGVREIALQAIRHGKDIAEKSGKRVNFEIVAETDAQLFGDRVKVVFDALLHLIRNAVDHGVETAGNIEIRFCAQGNNLHFAVGDDGRGIDLAIVKARAAERGLLRADAVLSERETLDLIFLPGFSTKSVVTEISGRGVGLDAVKTAVAAIGGTVGVTGESGKGATFAVVIPLVQNENSESSEP